MTKPRFFVLDSLRPGGRAASTPATMLASSAQARYLPPAKRQDIAYISLRSREVFSTIVAAGGPLETLLFKWLIHTSAM